MDKKFLTAEEAVAQFGIDPAEFQRLVDENQLRSLADRGSWKFRRDEIEQLISDGTLSAMFPGGDGTAQEGQTLELEPETEEAGPSDFAFLDENDEAAHEGATMIKPTADFEVPSDEAAGAPLALFPSDSEILMVDDEAVAADAGSSPTPSAEIPVAESLSEFDLVTLPGDGKSDSSLTNDSSMIVGGESSVIVGETESDSDVKVMPNAPVDSGILLADSAVNMGTEEHVIVSAGPISGISGSDSDVKIADSGISLEHPDSGITLEADSGITLEADSGLTLESSAVIPRDSDQTDSGFTLEADSGISLEPGDSGIALESDSGLSLEDDSGIAVAGARAAGRADLADDTQAEFEQLGDSGDHTAVFAAADSSELETLPPTKGMKAKAKALSETFETAEVEELEIAEDLDAGELEVDELDEDEDLEDVLEASDDAFSMEESGESSEASIASLPSVKGVTYSEPSWGMVAVIPVALGAALCLVQALILWDGVSTMWTGETAKAISAPIISALGG